MNCLGDELSEYMNRGRVVKEASCRGRVVRGSVVGDKLSGDEFTKCLIIILPRT